MHILETERRRNFEFGENTLEAYPKILVWSKKLDLNALFGGKLKSGK